MFAFNPTARTINPSDLTFAVKYSMKDAARITDNMLKSNYTIEVLALRSHSSSVSDHTTMDYFLTSIIINVTVILLCSWCEMKSSISA